MPLSFAQDERAYRFPSSGAFARILRFYHKEDSSVVSVRLCPVVNVSTSL
jgi:hypothetical protein